MDLSCPHLVLFAAGFCATWPNEKRFQWTSDEKLVKVNGRGYKSISENLASMSSLSGP